MSNLEHDFQTPQPNKADVMAHLTALFPPTFVHNFPDALIEIAYGMPGHLDRAELFSAFKLDAAADFAIAKNRRGCNVYVGPTLKKGDTPPFARTEDKDFLAGHWAWTDYDGEGELESARSKAKELNLAPGIIVQTGTVPHLRAHVYYNIAGGVTDREELERINKSVIGCLGGDAVGNPGRVLRLAGTVNYPSQKKSGRGYVVETVTVRTQPKPHEHAKAVLTGLRPDRTPSGGGASASDNSRRDPFADPFWGNVNSLALEKSGSWVPHLFPNARFEKGTGAWRISSRDLNRDNEEDLSISPKGIKDWGVWDVGDARQGRRSAIDIVKEYGGKNATEAALWLCEACGVDPATLGWRGTHKAQEAQPPGNVEPFDLWGHFEPPTLSRGVLPDVIESFAFEKGRELGADISGVAAAAIAVCAAAIPDHVKLQPKKGNTGWQVSARLWVAIVGPVSGVKSPIMTAAMRPLRNADTALSLEYGEARKYYDKLKGEEKEAANPPKQTRHVIQDATVEATQEIMRDSPNGLMCYRDELSSWFGAHERYANGKGSSDRGFWLEAFNGGPYSVDRIGRGSTYIPNLSISILGGIQPDKIREVVAATTDDGLLQRFLTITVKSAVLGLEGGEGAAVAGYARLIGDLFRLGAMVLEFDDEAQAYRRELEAKHLKLVAGAESVNPKLAGHIGKYNGIFAQLCIIWHCVKHAGPLAVIPRVISADTAMRAGAFLHNFVLRHAVAFYSDIIGLSNNHDAVTALAGYILAHKKTKITHRDIMRGDRAMARLDTVKKREEVADELAAWGWLERAPGPRANSQPQWNVNPLVHERFADRAKAEAERRKNAREMLHELYGKPRK
jgi:hypothetical protein